MPQAATEAWAAPPVFSSGCRDSSQRQTRDHASEASCGEGRALLEQELRCWPIEAPTKRGHDKAAQSDQPDGKQPVAVIDMITRPHGTMRLGEIYTFRGRMGEKTRPSAEAAGDLMFGKQTNSSIQMPTLYRQGTLKHERGAF